MGIPARYVENELHVFVEVFVPRVGWRRINLGGALVEERVAGADGKLPYRPKGDDPFPQPPEFVAAVAAEGAQGRRRRAAPPPAEARAAARHGSAGRDGAAARVDLDQLDREVAPGTPGARVSTASATTTITVSIATRETFRGERIEVGGTIAASDGKPGGLPVEIYLDGPGGALKVGDAAADASGGWHATIEVPRSLPLGDHRVVARTPGDAQRKPSHSH